MKSNARLIAQNVLLAVFTLTFCLIGRAQFAIIAHEGFNYSAGPLSGQNGGTGWTSAWTNDYAAGATLQVNTNAMTYSNLTTEGGRAVWGSGGNGISEDSRALPVQNNGVVYIQFLSQFGSSSGGGTPNIRLLNSGAVTGGFGGNGGPRAPFMSILDSSLNAASDGSSSTSATLGSSNLVVARIDYLAQKTSMWVNPDLSTFDYDNPGTTPNATFAGLAPIFNSLSIISRSPANVDEITVLYKATPTPAPTLISPIANSDNVSLYISYTLPVTPLAGSVQLSFTNDLQSITLVMTNSTNVSFLLPLGNSLNSSYIVSTIPPSSRLPDGNYTVTLSYQDTNSDAAASVVATNIVVDTITKTPVLVAPTNGAVVDSATGLHISYWLPEAPMPGSVEMIFTNSAGFVVLFMNDNLTNDFVVSPKFLTNAAINSATSPTLPDGLYTLVALTYRDASMNPANTVGLTNMLVDTVTQPPVLFDLTNNEVVTSAGLHISYQLPEAPASGSVTILFQNAATNIVLYLNDSLTNDFIVSPEFLTNAAITSNTSLTLPDGTYNVQFSYQDTLLNPDATIVLTNILVDTVTQPSTLLAPTNNTTGSSAGLHIGYQLAESPASGSVAITFQNAATNVVLYLNDNLTNDFVVLPGFLTNAAITSNTSSTLPDGSYTVSLSYQDAGLNPANFAVVTNVVVDTITQPPVLVAPVDNESFGSAGVHIRYQLPETPASGSVTISFQNSATNITLHLNDGLTNDFVVSPKSLTNAAVTSATSSALPDGTYTVSLSYQDGLLNPSASIVVTNVSVDTITRPPVLLAPGDNAVVASSTSLHISYQLPETPASGSVRITFQNSMTNIVLHLNENLTNDFVVSPESLTSATEITSATASVLPDGNYNVQLSYQDALSNPASSSGATNVLVDTVTLTPVLLAPADNAVISSTGLHISYQLPETPAPGSVVMTFQSSANTVILQLNNTQMNDFVVRPSALQSGAAITSASSSMLPDGRYSVSLRYQDAPLNPGVQVQATNALVVLESLRFYPISLAHTNGVFELQFSNNLPTGLGFNYELLNSSNLYTPLDGWTDLGPVTETPPGHFQFQGTPTNSPEEFYILRVY